MHLWSGRTLVIVLIIIAMQSHFFYLYQEYGAYYETMSQKLLAVSKSIPTWGAYERAMEAFTSSSTYQSTSHQGSKRGLALEDMLIKVCEPYRVIDLHTDALANIAYSENLPIPIAVHRASKVLSCF